jgi:hypothetical protein
MTTPLRALLDDAALIFPAFPRPLLRLMAALAQGRGGGRDMHQVCAWGGGGGMRLSVGGEGRVCVVRVRGVSRAFSMSAGTFGGLCATPLAYYRPTLVLIDPPWCWRPGCRC